MIQWIFSNIKLGISIITYKRLTSCIVHHTQLKRDNFLHTNLN